MKNNEKVTTDKKPPSRRRFTFIIVIFLNVILLISAFLLYAGYSLAYKQSLWDENLANVANLNHSAAMNATSLITSWNTKLDDISRYIELHELSYEEALQLISDTNSNDDRYFELINKDYTGHAAKKNEDGTFTALSYTDSSYETLHKAFDDTQDDDFVDIGFAPEFTDSGTGIKYFATYKHIKLKNDEGNLETYTLLLASKSENVLAVFNNQNDYDGQSTVLIDPKGNYIVSNIDFKSTNFFNYLYVYNDLTLDEENDIKREMTDKGSGELFYNNAGVQIENCVFRYERMSTNDWYCITSIPISSFHEAVFNFNYIVMAVLILVALLIVDVGWLQKTNKRLRTSIERETEASAAKGNFMSRMSHEIRTPLNAVIGYTTIAQNELSKENEEEEHKRVKLKVMDCLDKSSIASKHLLTIINDVLDMSAIESGHIKVAHEQFDFKALITSLTTVFYSQAKAKGVKYDAILDTLTEECFIGDQMRTNQILTNLLSNAVKFTPEGGSVKLLIKQSNAEGNVCHIHFEIIDTGIGMSDEYLKRIWTPFEQADSSISRRFGGTGLGLSITKSLVDLMGGSISVNSKLNKGTTFTFDLAFERVEQSPALPTCDFSGINALVVDDDSCTCEYIMQLFLQIGARCTPTVSGRNALDLFTASKRTKDPYTLCIIDWQMPEMSGMETIERLRKIADGAMPTIVTTAYDFTEIIDSKKDNGADMFISKPLFPSSLLDLLSSICGQKVLTTPEDNFKFDFSGSRILLAEDNPMNMEIAKEILLMSGVEIDCIWNGQEAVEKFAASPPGTYSAILMDVHMPVLNGHEATRIIRKSSHPQAKTIPIIAMTADAFAENVSEARAAGMNDHISKPIDSQTLFETLSKYITK